MHPICHNRQSLNHKQPLKDVQAWKSPVCTPLKARIGGLRGNLQAIKERRTTPKWVVSYNRFHQPGMWVGGGGEEEGLVNSKWWYDSLDRLEWMRSSNNVNDKPNCFSQAVVWQSEQNLGEGSFKINFINVFIFIYVLNFYAVLPGMLDAERCA